MAERRNYWSRAAVVSRIVKWLKTYPGDALPPATDPTVAERILKWLSWRGLARRVDGTWKPAPPLVHPADLKKVEEG